MWYDAGFLTETYHSILLQRLTHHDGVQGVVRSSPLAMGATPAGHMSLPIAPPQKCLAAVRQLSPVGDHGSDGGGGGTAGTCDYKYERTNE